MIITILQVELYRILKVCSESNNMATACLKLTLFFTDFTIRLHQISKIFWFEMSICVQDTTTGFKLWLILNYLETLLIWRLYIGTGVRLYIQLFDINHD